jgi:HK97 gp10 family phage protein
MPLKGAKAHINRLKRLSSPEAERAIGKALFAGGEAIQVEAQLSITRGAVSGRNHVPSRPGEPPNQDTGVLASNIETVQISPTLVEVSSNAPYSAPLEFGTSKMAARPFMRPARDKMRAEVTELVRRAVAKIAKGGTI